MSLSKLQLGLAGAILATGAGFYAVQEQTNAALRAELAGMAQRTGEIARLRQEHEQLQRTTSQVASLQVSEAELARLQGEVAAQQQRLKALAKPVPRPAARVSSGSLVAETLDIANLDARPKPTSMLAPVYPQAMATAGIEGSVVVSFVIDATGKVRGAEVVRSSRPEFEAAAIAAVENWQFDPGLKGGRQVNTRVSQKIGFTLAGKSGPAPAPANWF